ncbi:MAG: alpha/beta hydrolase [Bacillota bacterium]|nr:alpha/beta hydrolase [Bacillota bacterium]
MGVKDYFVNKMLAGWEKSDCIRLAGISLPLEIEEKRDIPYMPDSLRGHLLDVYHSKNRDTPQPVLIDIHGGGFMSGYKELNRLFGYYMAKQGFLVFNLNYRLAVSGVKISDQIRDIAEAAEYIWHNLSDYGGDESAVYLCGHSAGAVLAVIEALISDSERLRMVFGVSQTNNHRFQGLALDCGMMTFYQKSIPYCGMRSMILKKGYAKSEEYKNMIWANTPEFQNLPRTFLVSNKKDELRKMTLDFKRILDNKQVVNKLNFDGEDGHMGIIYNQDSEKNTEIINELITWLTKVK